ncbi:MAG: hypothetical protein E7614_06305 [Ruminococcaceae bacterium]|nr:hypothetical protein [Oscillospiraceae bacterium]
MKNIMKKVLLMLLALFLFLPAFSSVAVFAEDEEGELTADKIWEIKDPAYMNAGFSSLEERIKGNETIGSMRLVLVKDGMALYNDAYTGEVIVLKLKKASEGEKQDENGYKLSDNGFYDYAGYWTTNPYNISSSSNTAGADTSASIKKNLYSQLVIKFTEKSAEKTFFSYKDSVQYDQITSKDIKGGLRVEYVVGRLSVKYLVPEVITLDRWFDIYMKFKDHYGAYEANRFAAYYRLYVDDIKTDARIAEIEKECSLVSFNNLTPEHKKDYPVSLTGGLAICDTNIKEQERKNIEGDLRAFYSFEELEADHAETGYVSTDVESPVFRLALEYTLNKDGVSVRCNAANVRFDSGKYSLSNILMLPFAGTGNVSNEGYVFSPDGCGTIYDFEDIYIKAISTSENVFGQDYSFSTVGGANKEAIRVPVFGIVENEKITIKDESTDVTPDTDEQPDVNEQPDEQPDESEDPEDDEADEEEVYYKKHGFFAVIEKGESLANIIIERQGTFHTYVQAYTGFNPRPKDTYALTGGISAGTNALWTVEADRKYTGDFTLKIFILEEDECSYVGMAKKYRQYLTDNGVLKPIDDKNENIPLYLETVGAIDSTDRFMGVPYEIKQELTTYENTIEILRQLMTEANIDNINIKMAGWVNGGINSLVPTKIELLKELGGEEGFKKLVDYCNENGFGLFPEFEFSYAVANELFDDFDAKKHLAKTIDNRNAYKKEYDALMQAYAYSNKGIISTNSMLKFYKSLYEDFDDYGIKNISVSSLGTDLSSDFNKDDPLNREDSKTLMSQLLEKMAKDNEQVMISGGNSFAWEYVDHILGLPLENTMHIYATASVPFLSMVLHGSINYSGSAINLAGDYDKFLLKTIENGANPYFIIAYENASELKANHVLSEYYSVRYSILKQTIVDTYGELNKVLNCTKNFYINSHEYLDESYNLVKVGYSKDMNAVDSANDYVYYINYGLEEVSFVDNGIEYIIDSLGYILVDANGKIVD